jgi:hypothetical protein
MGKAMLIIVFGITIVAGKTVTGLNKRNLPLNQSAAKHYENLIAGNIARSGASIAISKLFRDPQWRSGLGSTNFDGGQFNVTVADLDTTVQVTSTGVYGHAQKSIQIMLKPGALQVLLVVQNTNPLTGQDAAKKAQIESWGFVVNVIDDQASQSEFDAAVNKNQVVYISEEVNHGFVDNKLQWAPIGLVNEDKDLSDHQIGFSTSFRTWTGLEIKIINNSHPITAGFPLGNLTITNDTWNLHRADGGFAPGGISLAEKPAQSGKPALMAVDAGQALIFGPAPARRVRLPWGNHSINFNTINQNGLTIMRRAIEWAIGDNPANRALMIASWREF